VELPCQLTAESARALARRLFSTEQFAADPRACILGAFAWLDCAAEEPSPGATVNPACDSRIERLDRIVQEQGLEIVSEKVAVSLNSLKIFDSIPQAKAFLDSVLAFETPKIPPS
jgi:hypothetical protein